MERNSVSSSNIISVGYDEAAQTLEIEFASGDVYQYYNVGAALYEQFMQAQSKGQFLSYNIRNSYPYSKI